MGGSRFAICVPHSPNPTPFLPPPRPQKTHSEFPAFPRVSLLSQMQIKLFRAITGLLKGACVLQPPSLSVFCGSVASRSFQVVPLSGQLATNLGMSRSITVDKGPVTRFLTGSFVDRNEFARTPFRSPVRPMGPCARANRRVWECVNTGCVPCVPCVPQA